MPMPVAVVLALLAGGQEPTWQSAAPPALLAAMVDEPTQEARRRAAEALAARSLTLPTWLAAARMLPLRRDEPAAVDGRNRRYRVPLSILGADRIGDIHVRVPAEAERRTGPMPLLVVWHAARSDGAEALAAWAPLADRFGFLLEFAERFDRTFLPIATVTLP